MAKYNWKKHKKTKFDRDSFTWNFDSVTLDTAISYEDSDLETVEISSDRIITVPAIDWSEQNQNSYALPNWTYTAPTSGNYTITTTNGTDGSFTTSAWIQQGEAITVDSAAIYG